MKALWLALLLFSMPVAAQTSAGAAKPPSMESVQAATPQTVAAVKQGQIASASEVADPVMGIHVHALGLERVVEMLQWSKPDPLGHYDQVWDAARLDSSGRDASHQNTGEFPFNGERWWVADAQIDGHPVSPDVLAALDKQGAWSPLVPDASQLPANLAATFQASGAWLSTSQDNMHPQVGDVRVGWRVISNSPAPAGVVLVAGRWELPPKTVAAALVASPPSLNPSRPLPALTSVHATRGWVQQFFDDPYAWLIAAGIAFALLLLAGVWRRRSKQVPAPRTRKARKKKS